MIEVTSTVGDEIIPEEIYTWLKSRESIFSMVHFKVFYHKHSEAEIKERSDIVSKYKIGLLKDTRDPYWGFRTLSFLFPAETWNIQIVGGSNKDGGIVGPGSDDFFCKFSEDQKLKIFGFADLSKFDKYSDTVYLLPKI